MGFAYCSDLSEHREMDVWSVQTVLQWTEAASDFTCCNDKSSSDPVVSVDALV